MLQEVRRQGRRRRAAWRDILLALLCVKHLAPLHPARKCVPWTWLDRLTSIKTGPHETHACVCLERPAAPLLRSSHHGLDCCAWSCACGSGLDAACITCLLRPAPVGPCLACMRHPKGCPTQCNTCQVAFCYMKSEGLLSCLVYLCMVTAGCARMVRQQCCCHQGSRDQGTAIPAGAGLGLTGQVMRSGTTALSSKSL